MKKKWLPIAVLVCCALLFAKRLTGEHVHAVLSLPVIVFEVLHVRRYAGRNREENAKLRWETRILLILLTAAAISGLLIHPLHAAAAVTVIHKIAAVLFAIHLIRHAVRYHRSENVTGKCGQQGANPLQ